MNNRPTPFLTLTSSIALQKGVALLARRGPCILMFVGMDQKKKEGEEKRVTKGDVRPGGALADIRPIVTMA